MESTSGQVDGHAKWEQVRALYPWQIGSDEVGVGSWAGPCVTCAVAVPRDWKPPKGLDDSKKLRPKKREELYEFMRDKVAYAYEMAHPLEIDRDGIIPALKRCFISCIEQVLDQHPEALVVVDGEVKLPGIDHLYFPKADAIVPAVMAASVIGKVIHDRHMWKLAEEYPGYGFHKSSGYGTPDHMAALARLGPCPAHRKSYLPVKKIKDAQDLQELEEKGIVID